MDADKPTEIPATGWWQVIRRAWAEARTDQVPLPAAGVAFTGNGEGSEPVATWHTFTLENLLIVDEVDGSAFHHDAATTSC